MHNDFEVGRGLFPPGVKHPRNHAQHLMSEIISMNPQPGTFPVYI